MKKRGSPFVTKLGSLRSAPAWPRLRLCARPSRQNRPPPSQTSCLDKIFIQMPEDWLAPGIPRDRTARTATLAQAIAPFRQPSFVTPQNCNARSCQICNQHHATSPARGSRSRKLKLRNKMNLIWNETRTDPFPCNSCLKLLDSVWKWAYSPD